MITALLLAAAASASPAAEGPVLEAQVVEACQTWLATRPASGDQPAETRAVAGGLCVDGGLTPDSAKSFLAALSQQTGAPVIVIRSDGGDFNAAMDMADAIAARGATVVASFKCNSSCANYLLPAGKRRVVLADTVLLFHGGTGYEMIPEMASQVRDYYRKENKGDPNKSVAKVITDVSVMVERQDRFLTRVGISRTFFRWMALYNAMDTTEQTRHCGTPDAQVAFYPPQVLASFGYRIDDYRGPVDGAQFKTTLERLQKAERARYICVWQP